MSGAEASHPILVIARAGVVHGLSTSTGARVWTQTLTPNVQVETLELVVEDDLVLATTQAGDQLWCLDYRTGQIIGQVALPWQKGGRRYILVSGGRIFVANDYEVFCVDRQGRILWRDVSEASYVSGTTTMAVPGRVRHADMSK